MTIDDQTFRSLKEAVRRFVRKELVPAEVETDKRGSVAPSLRKAMAEMGLFGLTIPERYGGLALTVAQEMQLVVDIGWTAPAFHTVFGGNNGIGGEGIVMRGTDAQKEKFLPPLASGNLVGAFAMTEPDAGSDASAIKLRATAFGDGWTLTGTKRFITNAAVAGIFTVLARTGEFKDGSKGVSAFIVDANSKGISLGRAERTLGHSGSEVCDIIFNECFVPADCLLGTEGEGLKLGLEVLERGRVRVAALSIGHAKRLLHDSVEFSLSRQQFGQRIADFQLIQAMLADSHVDTYAAECMLAETSRAIDRGEHCTMNASACKLFASEMVNRVADRAIQIFGGAGYLLDFSPARFYRDARLYRLYEGTSEIQRLIIARELIKYNTS